MIILKLIHFLVIAAPGLYNHGKYSYSGMSRFGLHFVFYMINMAPNFNSAEGSYPSEIMNIYLVIMQEDDLFNGEPAIFSVKKLITHSKVSAYMHSFGTNFFLPFILTGAGAWVFLYEFNMFDTY